MRSLYCFALLLSLLVVGLPIEAQADPRGSLNQNSKEGSVGELGRHMEIYRGQLLDNAATVRHVYPDGSVLMRHTYGVTSARLAEFWFLVRGVDSKDWKKGQVRVLPKPLKVVGWHEYQTGNENVEVQILEPVKGEKKAD